MATKKDSTIPPAKGFSITEASPHHPIYKRGFIVGGFYTARRAQRPASSPSAAKPETPPSQEEPKK